MIFSLSKLKVSDNSGVKYVKCFKVFKTYVGTIGSLIYVSVKDAKSKSKLQKGDIVKGIIVRNKKSINRSTGNYFLFDSNEIVLFNGKGITPENYKELLDEFKYIVNNINTAEINGINFINFHINGRAGGFAWAIA